MTARDRFDCEELFRRLEDYVDRELSQDEVRLVENHLAQCEACAAEYKFESRFVQEVKQKLRRLDAPADLLQRISKALRAQHPPKS